MKILRNVAFLLSLVIAVPPDFAQGLCDFSRTARPEAISAFTRQAIVPEVLLEAFHPAQRKLSAALKRRAFGSLRNASVLIPGRILSWEVAGYIVGVFILCYVVSQVIERWTVRMFDRGFNITIEPLPISLDGMSSEKIEHLWSMPEVAAVTGAISVVRENFRGAAGLPGLTQDDIDAIKINAHENTFRIILGVFRKAWANVLIYNNAVKDRAGVQQRVVGGDFAGVRGPGRWITRGMHYAKYPVLFGFIALGMSMDMIESLNATVFNQPGLSGGSTIIVSGPGMKSIGQAPPIYADMIATKVLPHHAEEFSNPETALDPDQDVMTNLTRISYATGRPINQMEVVLLGRPREVGRLKAMLPNTSLADIETAIETCPAAPEGVVLVDPVTGLMARVISDGTFLPVIKAALGDSLTPGRHLVFYGSSRSQVAMMDLAAVAGFRAQGAVVSFKFMSRQVSDVEAKTGAYNFTPAEIEGSRVLNHYEPGLRHLRPDDYEAIWNHTKLFTLSSVRGDVDAVIPFITDNPLWKQRGVRINNGTAVSTLRLRTINSRGFGWFKHQSDRVKGFPKRIAMMGSPGAGKGAQGPALALELGVLHIATGDLVRRAAETDEFPEARRIMEAGGLIDDELMLDMLGTELKKEKYRDGYVLDGWPRNIKQLNLSRNYELSDGSKPLNFDAYIYFDISPETYETRRKARIAKAVHAKQKPREDDVDPKTVVKRMKTYEEATKPMINTLRNTEADKFIEVNTETPPEIEFETEQQSIDYVYEYRLLPALQAWVRAQAPRGSNSLGTRNRGNGFNHPTLLKLGIAHPGQPLERAVVLNSQLSAFIQRILDWILLPIQGTRFDWRQPAMVPSLANRFA